MLDIGVVMAITTVGSEIEAREMARALVKGGHAACVQVSPAVSSFYVWEDELCEDKEFQLWIKLSFSLIEPLKLWIKKNHPYEVPELLVFNVVEGGDSYIEWIRGRSV